MTLVSPPPSLALGDGDMRDSARRPLEETLSQQDAAAAKSQRTGERGAPKAAGSAPAASSALLDRPPAKGGGKGAGARKLGGAKDKEGAEKLQTLLVKAVLRLSQAERDTASIIFGTFLGDTESPVVTAAETQSKLYSAQVKGTPGHKLGPPHIYVFGGVLSALVEMGLAAGGANTAETLKEAQQSYEAMTIDERCQVVQFCRLSKTYVKERRRLTWSLGALETPEGQTQSHLLRVALARALVETKWERRFGRAPPSHLERELQGFLDSLLK